MSKKILFMSSAKLKAISFGLLLAVFCTVGMSFRPVYDENEAAEIVKSGPRHSHWTSGSCTTTYNNKIDYFKTTAQTRGNGTVYVSSSNASKTGATSSPAESGNIAGNESYLEWNTGLGTNGDQTTNLASAHSKKLYLWATPDNGYYFAGWSKSQSTNDGTSDALVFEYTHSLTGTGYSEYGTSQISTYESAGNPYEGQKHYAFFSPVTVDAVSPASSTINPVNALTTCDAYVGTISFETTGADSINDFTNNTVSLSKTGNGTFTITSGPTISGSTVSLNYKFTGNGTYGSRNNQATFTLTSKGTGASSKSATVTANFPSVGLSGSDVEVNTTTVSAATTASFTVNTMYVDGTEDFTSIPSAFSNISGPSGTWTLNSCTFNGTDFTTGAGSFTVNYTFTPNGAEGTTTAEFTLTAKAAVGGTTKTITLTALVEKPSVEEASVTIGGTTTKYDYLVDALVAANGAASVPTVKLLKDVTISSTQTLSRTMTFDLNSFTLNANLSSSATKALSITQGAQVTFVSSRAGGKLIAAGNYAGRLSAVEVTKGSFLLQSGDITLTNSNTGTTAAQMYACGVYLGISAYVGGRPTSMMQMSGGSITVNRPAGGSYAYGVYCDGTGTNSAAADLRNATITTNVTGGSYAYGAYIAGSSPITNMTISANAKDYACAVYVKADATTVIDAGSYSATATATNARALHSLGTARVSGNPTLTATATTSNATVVDQAGGTITLSNGTFTASTASTAYGLHQSAANATATIASGTFNVTATTTTAIGAYLQQSGNSLTTTGGIFTANSKTLAYGIKADNTNSTITAQNTSFTGFSDVSGATNAFGGRTVGTATFTNCVLEGNTKSAAYGLVIGNGTTTITGGSFSAVAEGATAVGLYPKDNAAAKMNVSGTEITATGTTGVAGVKVATGEITLENTTISATGTSAARSVEIAAAAKATVTNSSFDTEGGVGVYNYGTLDINTTTVTSSTYALYLNASKATKVSSGHFKGTTNALGTTGTIGANNNQFTGGFYNTNSGLAARCASGYQVFTLPSGNSEQMAGYLYSIGTPDAPGYSVCKNVQRNKEYLTLSEALQEVTSGQTIVMTSDYTLPAGNYTLPAGATLLVPYKADQTAAIGDGSKSNCTGSYTSPSAFRTLTFADGVNFVVKGIFELSALIHADGQWACEGSTTGKYGKLHMSEGAKIELEGKLYSWGYVTGTGVIEAKNGSAILEPFQMADWPGGSNALSMRNHNAFMITHYFYQNIECNIYYRPGSNALGTSAAIMSGSTYYVQNVKLVGQTGDNAMFLMDKNDTNPDSWVHRKYNPSTDINTWTVNSGANLGGITVSVSYITMNSANYDLPITSNMAIVLNYGDMQITQNVNFLPGSKLEIHKEGRVFIKGVKVGFFNFSDYKGRYYGARYSPTWGTTNPRGSLSNAVLTLKEAYKKDAEMFVHGVFDIMPNGNTKGSLYTSPTGSNIHSTNEDAGMILYSSAAPAAGSIYYVGGSSYNDGNQTASVVAAKLQNGDASYSDTEGTTAGQLWGYKNDRWIKMRGGDCLYEELDGSGNPTGVVNAYPSSFVEVEPNDPDDHAYHATADVSKYVINTEASTTSSNPICTWWDAVPKEGGHYMISNPKSDLDGAYYYYDETASYWKPRNYRINWYNNTSLVIYNNVARNARPKFTGRGYNSSNTLVNGQTIAVPTETGYNFYWDGWVTDNADRVNQDCRVLDNEDMPRATGETTYYAHFKKEIKKYTITFLAEDGKTTIEQLTVNHGETPVCSAPPTKTATTENIYTLVWSPALSAATKEQKYTATFTPSPRPYTITFVNYNGDVLKQEEVTYGSRPTAPTNPTRQNDGFYSYDFTGWQAGETFVAAGGTLPTVTGVTTYTAQFSTTDWTPEYTIEFQDEDGTSLQTQHIRLGNTLTDPSATLLASGKLQKAEDAGHTYVFDSWSPTLKTTPDADATYTATYRAATTKQYTITFKDEDGFVLQSSEVNYGTTPTFGGSTPTKDQDDEWVYTFGGWTPAVTDVTGEQIYTATYNKTKRKYTILFKHNGAALTNNAAPDNKWEYGTLPYFEGATPAKAPEGGIYYAFDRWTPVAVPVTSDMMYYAHFSETAITYTVTWKTEDGSEILRTDENVPHGSIPTFGGTTPTKEATAQYTYTHDGWSGTIGGERLTMPLPALTGDAIFYAHFSQKINPYDVIFNLQGHGAAIDKQTLDYGSKAAKPTDPTETGYVFGGWYKEAGCTNAWNFSTDVITADTILYAKWTSAETGFYVDIVDVQNANASSGTLTINTNGWASSGWPYTVNEVVYEKGNREADRTLLVPYNGEVGETFSITVTNKNSVIVSKHNYIIPAEITANANLADQQILYVKSGATLTVNVDKTVKNIYVAPGAKMVVNNDITLTADTVFLRTTPWASAELELDGTISGQVCYTRIIKKKDQYYQFGLPMDCPIANVRLSDGSTPTYGNGWLLRSYSEQHRAQHGSGADIDNWVTLTNEGADVNKTIQGCVGYEMFSNSGYYREYYFPVAHTGLSDRVAVTRTTEATVGAAQEGWNIIVSPLMRTYTQSPAPEGATLSWLQEDGSYWQLPVTEIKPAIPFSYQATQTGYIVFDSEISLPAPQRRVAAAEEYKQIQWLQLDLAGAEGQKDETSIYAHPTRYEQTYQIGIDVAKQSLTATRALIYSSHAYGEMAFVGVPDSILEQGVALTVYSPKAQELTISMRENEWLNRMAYVWLIDQATGAQIDLLESDYSFNAEAGTTAGRFILMGAFFAPQITTDNGTVQGDEGVKATKFIYNDKMYIQINGVIYDATGKLVK